MLPSGLPELVGASEDLARFLTQSSHFNRKTTKAVAFLPSARSAETSVSRHGARPEPDLWQLGKVAAGGRTLYGAAILKAEEVRSVELDLFADEPPPRHAAIRRWPTSDDPDLEKAQRKELALRLAAMAGPPLLMR